jgi:hypothetical protein
MIKTADRRAFAAMSALGQKQTFAVQKGMSALPPIADIHPRDWIGMQIKANAARTILFIAPRPDQVL